MQATSPVQNPSRQLAQPELQLRQHTCCIKRLWPSNAVHQKTGMEDARNISKTMVHALLCAAFAMLATITSSASPCWQCNRQIVRPQHHRNLYRSLTMHSLGLQVVMTSGASMWLCGIRHASVPNHTHLLLLQGRTQQRKPKEA